MTEVLYEQMIIFNFRIMEFGKPSAQVLTLYSHARIRFNNAYTLNI